MTVTLIFAILGVSTTMKLNPLTPEEQRVIVDKGTEAPFSGEYDNFFEKGVYVCKRCGAPLFRSDSKFDAGCGWPSFDQAIPGAVKRLPDPDGQRTEIECARCGAHLGHVFTGEGLTPRNTRYCVNSISMKFIPADDPKATAAVPSPHTEKAIFAGGCFWGMQYQFERAKGVLSTRVGYTGGTKPNPTYEDVCRGDTGHAEAVEVTFDPSVTTYEDLVKFFFDIHDPTQVNRQGPDIGYQYRSAILYLTDEQKQTAEKVIRMLEAKGYSVATQVVKATTFWPAEDYHQDYYQKTGGVPYCHVYVNRF